MEHDDIVSLLQLIYDKVQRIDNTTCYLIADNKDDGNSRMCAGLVDTHNYDINKLKNRIAFEPIYDIIFGKTMFIGITGKQRENIDSLALLIDHSLNNLYSTTILYSMTLHKLIAKFNGYTRIVKNGNKIIVASIYGKLLRDTVVVFNADTNKYNIFNRALNYSGEELSDKFKYEMFISTGTKLTVISKDGKELSLIEFLKTVYEKVEKQVKIGTNMECAGFKATYKDGTVDLISDQGDIINQLN